jgi:hypothetical protein
MVLGVYLNSENENHHTLTIDRLSDHEERVKVTKYGPDPIHWEDQKNYDGCERKCVQ